MKTLITQAIQQRRMLRLIYNNKTRTVEPYALGVTEDNREAMLCWQVTPPTLGKEHWQLFYLTQISGMRMVDTPIEQPEADRQPPLKDFASTYIAVSP